MKSREFTALKWIFSIEMMDSFHSLEKKNLISGVVYREIDEEGNEIIYVMSLPVQITADTTNTGKVVLFGRKFIPEKWPNQQLVKHAQEVVNKFVQQRKVPSYWIMTQNMLLNLAGLTKTDEGNFEIPGRLLGLEIKIIDEDLTTREVLPDEFSLISES